MKRCSYFLCVCVLLAFSLAVSARTWTNKQGNTLEAEYDSYKDPFVFLKSKTGKVYKIKYTDLVKADQDYVKKMYDHEKLGTGKPSDPKSVNNNPLKVTGTGGLALNPAIGTVAKSTVRVSWMEGGSVMVYDSSANRHKAIAKVEITKGKLPAGGPSISHAIFSYDGERVYASSPGNPIYMVEFRSGAKKEVGKGFLTDVTWDAASKSDILWIQKDPEADYHTGFLYRLPVTNGTPGTEKKVWDKKL